MKVAAIITSYDGHLYCLEDVIRAAKKAADVVICGYDVHNKLPPPIIIKKCDYFFTVGRNDWNTMRVSRRKQLGEIAQIKTGILLAVDSDYIVKIDGDVLIRRSYGVRSLINTHMGHTGLNDIIVSKRKEVYGTTVYIGRTRAIKAIYSRIDPMTRPQIEGQMHKIIQKAMKMRLLKCAELTNDEFIKTLDYTRVKNI